MLSTKYRRKIIDEGMGKYLELKSRAIEEHYPKMRIQEFNYDKDHVHLLVSIPPSSKVGDFVRIYKTNTSRGIKERFQFLKEVYWGQDGIWSDGYFVSTVGINESVIRKYIEEQGKEDAGQTGFLFEIN